MRRVGLYYSYLHVTIDIGLIFQYFTFNLIFTLALTLGGNGRVPWVQRKQRKIENSPAADDS